MNDEQQSFVVRVTRYGLPVVVGIFYLTASLGFSFTSDSTFRLLDVVRTAGDRSIFPSPLWQFFLLVGGKFGLDLLLVSKVLSLLFSCAAILLVYLLANEILRDRLIAFCVSLAFGMEGWMLQLAPSGSALSLAVVLILAGLFFMLRNEYVVAPFMVGLCALVAWQAVFLLIPLCFDIWINSVNKRRAVKVAVSTCLLFCSSLLPLVLYEWSTGRWNLPVLLQVAEFPGFSLSMLTGLALLSLLGIAGFVIGARFGEGATMRTNGGVIGFVIVAVLMAPLYDIQIWIAALPLVLVYAYVGLSELLKWVDKSRLLYSLSFVLTGLLVVHLQSEYQRTNRRAMVTTVAQNAELRILSEWVRENAAGTSSVCAEHPGIVGYYAGRQVSPLADHGEPSCDFLVTSRKNLQGYRTAFKPPAIPEDIQSFAVWRRE